MCRSRERQTTNDKIDARAKTAAKQNSISHPLSTECEHSINSNTFTQACIYNTEEYLPLTPHIPMASET